MKRKRQLRRLQDFDDGYCVICGKDFGGSGDVCSFCRSCGW